MNFEAKNAFIQRAQAALDFSGKQLRHLIIQHPDHFPLYTVKGKKPPKCRSHESLRVRKLHRSTPKGAGNIAPGVVPLTRNSLVWRPVIRPVRNLAGGAM
jgi:hypothetical protein